MRSSDFPETGSVLTRVSVRFRTPSSERKVSARPERNATPWLTRTSGDAGRTFPTLCPSSAGSFSPAPHPAPASSAFPTPFTTAASSFSGMASEPTPDTISESSTGSIIPKPTSGTGFSVSSFSIVSADPSYGSVSEGASTYSETPSSTLPRRLSSSTTVSSPPSNIPSKREDLKLRVESIRSSNESRATMFMTWMLRFWPIL